MLAILARLIPSLWPNSFLALCSTEEEKRDSASCNAQGEMQAQTCWTSKDDGERSFRCLEDKARNSYALPKQSEHC